MQSIPCDWQISRARLNIHVEPLLCVRKQAKRFGLAVAHYALSFTPISGSISFIAASASSVSVR